MRNRLFYFAPVLLFCLLISISSQSQLPKIYVHPKAPGREKQSKFIDSIRFIPLQTKEGIQLGAYYNIDLTEKYLLVNDYLNKRLLLYSKNGDFVKELKYNKLGGNFYPSYNEHLNQITFFGSNKNYDLTPKDEIKIKLDWNNPRNKKYFKKFIVDLNDPSLTIKKSIPDEKDILQLYHYYDDYYAQGDISTSPLYKDSLDYEFKLYKNNQLVKGFFPYNHINEPRFLYGSENVYFTQVCTTINFITRPFCDTIYKMIKDSVFPAYQLVLPLENSLPKSFFIVPFKNKTEQENFYRNNGSFFHQVYSFYETPRFMFFKIRYFATSDTYVYEKQTNVIYRTTNIKADSTQYNLQLLTPQGANRKGDKFFKSQKASDLIPFFEQNKNVPVPKELISFLKSKPPGTTPIIVKFKFKN